MKKRPMVLIFAGILSGTAVVWNGMSITTAFYMLAGICLAAYLFYNDKRYGFIMVGIFLGIVFSILSKVSINLDLSQIKKKNSDSTQGTVLEVSRSKTGKQVLHLENEKQQGHILLYTPSKVKIVIGDVVSFTGDIEVFEDATNPGQFSLRHYYFSKGIYYRAYSKDVCIRSHTKEPFRQIMTQCKTYLKGQLDQQYKGDVQRFLKGMMLGEKKELSDEIKDDFKQSGLIHLLAVSGLHISLAGRSLYQLIRKFCGNFMISSAIGFSAALFYCMLTGMSVSSLRALIMLGVYLFSEILGEHYDMMSCAAFAGIILLITCPYRIYDTGFIYSFTAVFVIGWYQTVRPKMKGKFKRLKQSLLFCFVIQVGMMPVMIYFQYEISVFSFLANTAAVPLATTGFTMAFLLILLPYTIFHEMISYLVEMVLFISRQSYGTLTIGHIPFLWVLVFYGVIFLCFCKKSTKRFLLRLSVIYTGILILILIPLFRRKTITFLDVGQGDCFVADTNAGLIMFDGGSSSENEVGRYRILPFIKYLGYQTVKIAVISHMDTDHYSGILELLKMGRIEYLGLPEIEKDTEMEKIIKTADKQHTKIFYLSKGKSLWIKGGNLKVLHPVADSVMDKNAASLVMQGKLLGYRLLLTGDVEKEGEEELLTRGLHHTEILKVAHHGSKNSTTNEFLQKVMPEQAVISCGKQNRYGHPHQETIHRLMAYQAKILRTDQKGAIIFNAKRDG